MTFRARKRQIRAETEKEMTIPARKSPIWARTREGMAINEDSRANIVGPGIQRTAAAYSPTWWGSTIGDGGLNFSVRNGKRWYPAAIATAIYYLREITNSALPSENRFSDLLLLPAFSWLSFFSGKISGY